MGPFLDGDSQVGGKSVDDDVRSSLRGHVRISTPLSPFHPSPFAFPFSVRTVTSRLDLN